MSLAGQVRVTDISGLLLLDVPDRVNQNPTQYLGELN
jgi:hypothetical protein